MVTIEWRQYNLRDAVTMLKNTLKPARIGMWGIQSLVHELAEMVQSRDANKFCPGQYGRNLYHIAMRRAFSVEKSKELTKKQKNQVHQIAQKTLSRYGIQDGYLPLVFADGMLLQLRPDIDLVQEHRAAYWDNQDLMLQVFKMRREFLQRPIWMLKQVTLDPQIPVMEEQKMHVVKVAHKIWADFKEKTRDHIAPRFDTTALPAQVGSNIFLVSWDKILLLATEIADIINLEQNEKPDVGAFAFGIKKRNCFASRAMSLCSGIVWARDTRHSRRCCHWFRRPLSMPLLSKKPIRSEGLSSSCTGACIECKAWMSTWCLVSKGPVWTRH